MADLEYGETRDAIDLLIERLNAATEGKITFERDVLDVNRPEDWGAVEMTGPAYEYADGKVIDQYYPVDVWASVSDRSSKWLRVIEGAMAGLGISYTLVQRSYLHDLNKVMWRWQAQLWSLDPADYPEAESDGETDG
jgi:hypothetical protein